MHCLCPGLFRSLLRGDRKKQKLDITYQHGDELVRFIGFEPLDVTDMRLLQGLVALSGPHGLDLTPEPKTSLGNILRVAMKIGFDAEDQNAMMVKTSISGLLTEIGMTDGGLNIKAVIASLTRMSNVSVIVKRGSRTGSFQLMTFAIDENDGNLCVALNPRLTKAIVGGKHVRIDMGEVRALESDPARLVHQRLCAWINPGSVGRIEIDTMCSYVWTDQASPEAMKKRRQAIRRSISELIKIGWLITEYSSGKFEILRNTCKLHPKSATQNDGKPATDYDPKSATESNRKTTT
jgi:hypothetical protein